MVVIWVFGKIFKGLGLPVIFGELIGGIIVGPLAFNLVDPESEIITILGELGIFFLMLHAGLETNPKKFLHSSKQSFLIAIGGILLPFIGGYFVSRWFGQDVESSLFLGLGLSTTAIVISARLFKDYKIQKTNVASTTLGAAVIDDIIVLILFSIILTFHKEGFINYKEAFFILFKSVAFFAALFFIGHKVSRYIPKFLVNKGFSLTLIVALFLGLIAQAIGLHIVLGAFVAGLFIREELVNEKVYKKIEDRIYGLSYSFLGPIFFASLAFHLDFLAIKTVPWFFLSILFVAIFGKIIGSGGMALFQKINKKDSLLIGVVMNSRGAVELIIASIGFKEGIIGKEVFSILILIAFITTLVSVFSMELLLGKKQKSKV